MAAITLWRSNAGYIDRQGVGKEALDKEMDALILAANQTVLQGGQFFRTVTSKSGTYKEAGFGDDAPLPPESEDSDLMPAYQPTPDFSKEITVKNRRLSIQVERSFVEDQLQDVARKMMSGLIRVGRLSIEYGFADILNNLTSTGAAYVGGDGVAVASATHPQRRRSVGTWSNIESATALTTDNLFTAFKNMRKRGDTRGYVYVIKPKLLVGPPELQKKMAEIKASVLVPENAMNTANVMKDMGDWGFFVYDYATDTNGWWLWGDEPADQNGFLFFRKVAPSIAPTTGKDTQTDIIWGQRLRMRVGFGTRVVKNIQYNAGA